MKEALNGNCPHCNKPLVKYLGKGDKKYFDELGQCQNKKCTHYGQCYFIQETTLI